MKYFLLILLGLFCFAARAQVARDSIVIEPVEKLIGTHPYFNMDGEPVQLAVEERHPASDDGLFYLIIGLTLYLAVMRLSFSKYFSTMFTLFFRATLRQQQLKEQMLQARLPALLMNLFFVVCLATYCVLLAGHNQLPLQGTFTELLLGGIVLIAAIYIGKFIVLNLLGWIFGMRSATDTYLFIVLLVNKMIAIFLLPFIILLAFPTSWLLPIVLLLSYILIVTMFIYRYMISYRPVRSEIKLTRLQFFLYICAFEIAPLLLIYKVLLTFEVSSFNN